MEEVNKNLEEIVDWLKSVPHADTFKSNREFLQFIVQLMNYTLYVLRVGIAVVPNYHIPENGYLKQKAIVVGLMTRLTKLYEGFLTHVSKNQAELAGIFVRLIYETEVKVDYFLRSKQKRKTRRNYILISYRAEKEILKILDDVSKNRELIPIEKRMKERITQLLKQDRISMADLEQNKNWELDGKNFRELLRFLNRDSEYAFGFGSASTFVHGNWHEINTYHLIKEGRYYFPKLSYKSVDPRVACPITILCLDRLEKFMRWNKTDYDDYLGKILVGLHGFAAEIDKAHENWLNTRKSHLNRKK